MTPSPITHQPKQHTARDNHHILQHNMSSSPLERIPEEKREEEGGQTSGRTQQAEQEGGSGMASSRIGEVRI